MTFTLDSLEKALAAHSPERDHCMNGPCLLIAGRFGVAILTPDDDVAEEGNRLELYDNHDGHHDVFETLEALEEGIADFKVNAES